MINFSGLLKVGLADAFVNFNLTSRSLLHSIKTSEGKVLIVGAGVYEFLLLHLQVKSWYALAKIPCYYNILKDYE